MLVLLFFNSQLYADELYKLVKYKCNIEEDNISIDYVAAFNNEGRKLVDNKGDNDWDPWDLVEIQDSRVVAYKEIHRTCNLSDYSYNIVISGSTYNSNLLGMCAANVTASINISTNKSSIYKGIFEGRCLTDQPVITNIVISTGGSLNIKSISMDEFLHEAYY